MAVMDSCASVCPPLYTLLSILYGTICFSGYLLYTETFFFSFQINMFNLCCLLYKKAKSYLSTNFHRFLKSLNTFKCGTTLNVSICTQTA